MSVVEQHDASHAGQASIAQSLEAEPTAPADASQVPFVPAQWQSSSSVAPTVARATPAIQTAGAGFLAIMWVIVSSTAFRVLACFALAMALLMYDTLFAN